MPPYPPLAGPGRDVAPFGERSRKPTRAEGPSRWSGKRGADAVVVARQQSCARRQSNPSHQKCALPRRRIDSPATHLRGSRSSPSPRARLPPFAPPHSRAFSPAEQGARTGAAWQARGSPFYASHVRSSRGSPRIARVGPKTCGCCASTRFAARAPSRAAMAALSVRGARGPAGGLSIPLGTDLWSIESGLARAPAASHAAEWSKLLRN